MSSISDTDLPAAASRHNQGKPKLSQLHWFRLEALAEHCSRGRDKYPDIDGEPNWLLGGKPDDEYLDSIARHLAELVKGNTHDEELGTLHAAAIAWNALALITLNQADLPVYHPQNPQYAPTYQYGGSVNAW